MCCVSFAPAPPTLPYLAYLARGIRSIRFGLLFPLATLSTRPHSEFLFIYAYLFMRALSENEYVRVELLNIYR